MKAERGEFRLESQKEKQQGPRGFRWWGWQNEQRKNYEAAAAGEAMEIKRDSETRQKG